MSDVLVLSVRGRYFREIQAGSKILEYRLRSAFWTRRIVGREFAWVEVRLGYPKADDSARRLRFPWRGYEEETIQHEHFGDEPVEVFAIRLAAGPGPMPTDS